MMRQCTTSPPTAAATRWKPCWWILLSLALMGIAREAAGQSEDLVLPDNPLRGRLLFESKHCFECHQFRDTGIGTDLVDGDFGDSFLGLGAALWNHVPGMTVQHELHDVPWPTLSSNEVVGTLAFVYYLRYLGRPGDSDRGGRLFESEGCATCHSWSDADESVGPQLAELTRFASPLYVAQAIWNHGPSMLVSMAERQMDPPHFEEGDLADISAHLRQRGRRAQQERLLLAPGNPNSGRELFARKGCGTCHVEGSASGAPDLLGADLHRSAEALAGTMWNHALEMERSMREENIEWPSFTTNELADLIAYLYFLPFSDPAGNADRGELVFVSRHCADCHGGREGSSHPGPDLTGDAVAGSPASLVAAMWNHAPIMKEVILEEGRPWPTLTGQNLRDLLAYLRSER